MLISVAELVMTYDNQRDNPYSLYGAQTVYHATWIISLGTLYNCKWTLCLADKYHVFVNSVYAASTVLPQNASLL